MDGFLFIIVFLVIAGAIVWGAAQHHQGTSAAWARAAADLGVAHDPGSTFRRARLSGQMGGCAVSVDTYTQRSGNNNAVFTRYRVAFPDLGLGVRLSRQTALSRVGRFFGMEDVELGDPAFDDAFVVKTDSADRLSLFLTPGRKTALVRLLASYGSAVITDTSAEVSTRGYERRPEAIVSITRRLVSIARILTERETPELSTAIEARTAGDLGDAARRLRVEVKPHPDDVDSRLLAAEMLHAAGDDDAARPVIDELSARMPADPDVVGLRERIMAPAGPSRQRPAAAQGPPAEQVAQDLFGPNRLSFETDAVFAETYRGSLILWEGRVKRHQPFQTDLDFGTGPGTKAVITVANITNDLYGQTEIDAVVHLPASADEVLERDKDVVFEGTLERIDPLMRNFFITGGRLV